MQLPEQFLDEFPEEAGHAVKAHVTGVLFINEKKVGRATLYIALGGFFIEYGRFLKGQTLLYFPYDYLDQFGFVQTGGDRVVVQFNTQSTRLQFHLDPTESADLLGGLFQHITKSRQHEATIGQTSPVETDEEGLRQMMLTTSQMLTGWELERIADAGKEAEDRVMAATASVIDLNPDILGQIASEMNALHDNGLDTSSFDVQTIALRRAGYLRPRGLSYLIVDVHNLQYRNE